MMEGDFDIPDEWRASFLVDKGSNNNQFNRFLVNTTNNSKNNGRYHQGGTAIPNVPIVPITPSLPIAPIPPPRNRLDNRRKTFKRNITEDEALRRITKGDSDASFLPLTSIPIQTTPTTSHPPQLSNNTLNKKMLKRRTRKLQNQQIDSLKNEKHQDWWENSSFFEYYVESDNKEEIIEPDGAKAIALWDFNCENENLRDLSFKKGDIITILRRFSNGWWEGELNGKIGDFPSSFIEEEEIFDDLLSPIISPRSNNNNNKFK